MAWALRKPGAMLSTALRNHKHEGGSQQNGGGGRSNGRTRARAATAAPERSPAHLKAVASDSEAAEGAHGSLADGEVAGLPIGRIPDSEDEAAAASPAGALADAGGGSTGESTPAVRTLIV